MTVTTAGPDLRPYQLAAGEATEAAFFDKGQNRLLIKKPTGAGKTVWFAALLRQFPRLRAWLETFPEHERKMLVIAHREELLTQAADKIMQANPGLTVGIEQAGSTAGPFSDVVIASIQTLAARDYRRLKTLIRYNTFRIVIVDECHHASARTYRETLSHLGFLPMTATGDELDLDTLQKDLAEWDTVAPKDRLLIGVTATPNRSDAVGLGCVFQSIAFSLDLRTMIDDGWLVPLTPWVVETDTSLDGVRTVAGEFNQKDLAETVNTPERNRLAVEAWRTYANGRSTLAFTVDVQHAHDAADVFNAQGISAAAISGETPKEERRSILANYTAGRITVLTNCMVLTEGTDLPRTSCILHLKPTKSATLYEQMTGRGLRLFKGKRDCVVVDLVDIARRHSLQTAPVLYGLPPLKPEGKSLKELQRELEVFQELYPQFDVHAALAEGRLTIEQLRAKAKSFDVWSVPELGAVGEGLSLTWIRTGDDVFRLQYPWGDGTETVKVEKDLLGHYDISCTFRPRGSFETRQRTVGAQIATAAAALTLAEAYVKTERRDVKRLKDRDAAWRRRPASEKQKALLRKRRVPFKPSILAGEASDLIDLAMSRRGMR